MFTPEFYIDSFQGTKKAMTDVVFKDKTLNKAAHAYIDAQTTFAKMLVSNTRDMTSYSMNSFTSSFLKKDTI